MFRLRNLPACLVLLAVSACSEAPRETTTDTARDAGTPAATAAVAMPDAPSAAVARAILERGGNAVDAAVAADFVLAVTEPEAGNIGGGGFMLIWLDREAYFLDYREKAPLAADVDMYLDADGNVIEAASLTGHLAVGVPGAVAGLWAAHQRFGKLHWQDVVMPAVLLARDGFTVHPNLAQEVADSRSRFAGRTNFDDYFADVEEGSVWRQPELALTLGRIAERGAHGFYHGETADLIVAEMERGGGLVTHEDLEAYAAIWREPLHAAWRDYDVWAAPPPSSGGFAVIQLLKMKDFLAHAFEGVPHNSPQYVHLVAEMEKRIFADRAEYLGDPDFVDVPLDRLLSDEYLAERAAEIRLDRISTLAEVQPGLGPLAESMNTTHYSVVDFDGNAVATTTTLNLEFGSGVVVTGAGFLLNDEMDDFSVKPGVPNAYGVVGNAANAIAPGKRMLSSMAPTILTRDGEATLVVGTPGGSTIFTTVFQMIVDAVDFGMSSLDAAGSARFHHQLLPPDLVTYSPSVPLPAATISGLGDMGYRVVPHSYDYGDVQMIQRAGDGWDAGSDPRKRGESLVMRRAP
ncbi:MAG TPA: gamma-glutamyltransferase [Woeseiaceae bacterium]|nr:gamma-glutamyltransferase [Woeseiaceae bacterium]